MRQLLRGDSRDLLDNLPSDSVDSCVTDPPYALVSTVKRFGSPKAAAAKDRDGAYARQSRGFMGQQWDTGQTAFDPAFWQEVLRVLKPGAFLLAFGGTRTYHRLACAIEDAGFEVRDQIGWLYGSGFPKSHNQGDGWGTALKPAWEPIVMARKHLSEKSVEANISKWGTGAINIDGCRVPLGDADASQLRTMERGVRSAEDGYGLNREAGEVQVAVVRPEGRWPANVVHDGSDDVVMAFPTAPGQQGYVGPEHGDRPSKGIYGDFGARPPSHPRADGGSASRFFYCAKASRKDRDENCADLPDQQGGMLSENSGQHITRRDGGAPGKVKNHHPTVKPTELMRYLCRLVTPTGGTVLDPFMGSGSTGKAALREGFSFIGIEQSAEYFEIAKRRVAA